MTARRPRDFSAPLEMTMLHRRHFTTLLREQLLEVQSAAAAGIRTVDAGDVRKNQLNPNNDAFWKARG